MMFNFTNKRIKELEQAVKEKEDELEKTKKEIIQFKETPWLPLIRDLKNRIKRAHMIRFDHAQTMAITYRIHDVSQYVLQAKQDAEWEADKDISILNEIIELLQKYNKD